MAQPDNVSLSIPEADLREIQTAIGVLKAKLMPHLICLSPQDRQEMPKMGDKTFPFVQKGIEYVVRYPSLAPTYLDVDALKIDMAAVTLARGLSQDLTPIAEAVNDTLTASGSEAYQGILLFYRAVGAAAKAKAPFAQSVYDDLATHFPGGPRKPAK